MFGVRVRAAIALTVLGVAGLGVRAEAAEPSTVTRSSSVRASDGQTYRITNHLTREVTAELATGARRHQWLLVWAGDESNNMADPRIQPPVPPTTDDPDFLAVVDVTRGSRTYGKVVNTVTMDTVFGNEPHHMQYQWHKGHKVYAGGLLSDITYVFDVKHLPEVQLSGVVPATATPCGSVPDAYQVLSDGTAYGSYLGGPDVAGPCTYTNGETREGNGFGGTPGEIVRISPTGEVLSESPAASTWDEGGTCGNIPALPQASCANPHGVAAREDLNRMVTGDFAEARNLLGAELPPDTIVLRDTVRIFDISNRSNPKLLSVTHLPDGPRVDPDVPFTEAFGTMETAAPHQSRHKGAFTMTMNGAIFYTPDITAGRPVWREVFDDHTAFKKLFPTDTPTSGADGGSWLAVSPDDRFLFHIVNGGGWDSPSEVETGLVFVLDIRRLLAAGTRTTCSIDTLAEAAGGGAEPDCPALVSVVPVRDMSSGGPHWGSMDTFRLGRGGFYQETDQVRRIATSNYFVAPTGFGGDHRVCLFTVGGGGELALDTSFKDEHTGTTCLSFNRTSWPHGERGNARPHGVLFAVADADIR